MDYQIGDEIFIIPEQLPGAYVHLQDCPWRLVQATSGYYGEPRWVAELSIIKDGKVNTIQLSILEEAICGKL